MREYKKDVGEVNHWSGLPARGRLILPIRLEPMNKQPASPDYCSYKSMLRRVKIFKLTINACRE